MTFVTQSAPDTKRKLQKLDEALEMNLSQLVDIAFKVYDGREQTPKKKRCKETDTIFVEVLCGSHKFRAPKKNKGGPLVENQFASCKKEGHWKKSVPKLKNKKVKEGKERKSQMIQQDADSDKE